MTSFQRIHGRLSPFRSPRIAEFEVSTPGSLGTRIAGIVVLVTDQAHSVTPQPGIHYSITPEFASGRQNGHLDFAALARVTAAPCRAKNWYS
jgi:hypothetical protein